jgi:hypothetical protein
MAELEEAVSTPEAPVESSADFDWMEQPIEGEEPIIAQGNTDWLTGVGLSKDDAQSTDDWVSDLPVEETDEAFDWAAELEDKPVPAATEKPMSGAHIEDFVNEDDIVPAHAENAPSWLNEMAPGFDVDPDAEEEAALEQEFVQTPVGHRQRSAEDEQSEFEWLSDIVEEESSAQPAVMPELPAAAEVPVPRAPRFSFSRLPAWLRRKTAAPTPEPVAPAAPPAAVSDEPEWLRDGDETGDNSDNNDDLPDWLK